MKLGKEITSEDFLDQLSFFSNWEEKYEFIIDLGRSLPKLSDHDYVDSNLVKGCQSQVWLKHEKQDQLFSFSADSDAIIVKGLLAIILLAFNYKTSEEILVFDIDNYFEKLDLLSHISNVRGNGLRAMVAHIQIIAS